MIVVAGNCVLEEMSVTKETVDFLFEMSDEYAFPIIYKSSWKKDNRSKPEGYVGPGVDKAIEMFEYARSMTLPTMSDFHTPDQLDIKELVGVVDWLQIPAYLCMQTDLVYKMADTMKPINVKKGQFLHPLDVSNVISKINSRGNDNIMLTERGTCFGYRDLVLDPRSLHIMRGFEYPVLCDVGHLGRKYGVRSSDLINGGDKSFVNTLAKSAIATGIEGIFVEVHPSPDKAKCDAATQLSFSEFESLIKETLPVWEVVNGYR